MSSGVPVFSEFNDNESLPAGDGYDADRIYTFDTPLKTFRRQQYLYLPVEVDNLIINVLELYDADPPDGFGRQYKGRRHCFLQNCALHGAMRYLQQKNRPISGNMRMYLANAKIDAMRRDTDTYEGFLAKAKEAAAGFRRNGDASNLRAVAALVREEGRALATEPYSSKMLRMANQLEALAASGELGEAGGLLEDIA